MAQRTLQRLVPTTLTTIFLLARGLRDMCHRRRGGGVAAIVATHENQWIRGFSGGGGALQTMGISRQTQIYIYIYIYVAGTFMYNGAAGF